MLYTENVAYNFQVRNDTSHWPMKVRKSGEQQNGARQQTNGKETVAVDWTCVTNEVVNSAGKLEPAIRLCS